MAIEALTPGPLILSKGFRNSGAPERVARAVSVVIAAAGLVFLSPVLALIAAAIKLDSKGPVMFVQARSGRDGRPFNLLKFRTMHPCEERASEWVQDNSDRITRVGGALRRFRLDELPQLVNVLRGEMNLVGPRPHPIVQRRDLRAAHRLLQPAVDGSPWSDRLGPGSIRLRQQHRGRNREDAVRPVLHQEPVPAPRRPNPSGDRWNRPARSWREPGSVTRTRPACRDDDAGGSANRCRRVPANLDLLSR